MLFFTPTSIKVAVANAWWTVFLSRIFIKTYLIPGEKLCKIKIEIKITIIIERVNIYIKQYSITKYMAELLDSNEIFTTNFEPKVQNRFIMYIDGIPAYMIKAANRPSVNNNPVTLDHINLKRKVKGKSEWQDVTITLYDAIVPSAAQAVMEWFRLAHESASGRNGYSDFYKKDVTINVLGPLGDKVEEWTLKGAFPASVNFGQLDWASGEPLTVEVVLSIDWALLSY